MHTILLVSLVITAVSLVAFVLLQQGKGADAGAAFGSGASATVFGARGSSSFLSRATAVLATLFFVLAMALAWISQAPRVPESVAERIPQTRDTPAPVEEAVEDEEPTPPADGG